MSTSLLTKILDAAHMAGATDVEIKVKPDQLSIKHRVMGAMVIPENDFQAPELVEAANLEFAAADMGKKDAARYTTDWLQGRHSTFGFGIPRVFARGQLNGDAKDFQMVIRLFAGPAEYSAFQQRISDPSN